MLVLIMMMMILLLRASSSLSPSLVELVIATLSCIFRLKEEEKSKKKFP